MKKFFFVIFFGLIVVFYAQQSTPKITAAVLDLHAYEGVSPKTALIIFDYLRTELVNTHKFIIVTRENMGEIFKEQQFQLSGCNSEECIIQAGKILGVNKVFVGTIGKVGQLFIINIKMLDVETGRIDKAQSKKVISQEKLLNAVKEIAELFAGIKKPQTENSSHYKNEPSHRADVSKTLPPKRKKKVEFVFFDLMYGYAFGNMQLQFIRSDPAMTPAEFGITGNIPSSFTAINWSNAKVSVKQSLAFRMNSYSKSRGFNFMMDFFYFNANIIPQNTDIIFNNNEKGSFTFYSNDYFSSSTFGLNIYDQKPIIISNFLHLYFAIGFGFNVNFWKAPYISGYTESDTFSPPSKGTNIGFSASLIGGFRFFLSRSIDLFLEYNFLLSGFEPSRKVKNENNLAGFMLHKINFGISYYFKIIN